MGMHDFPGEECCEICSVRYLKGAKRFDTDRGVSGYHYEEGHGESKMHTGYKLVREKHAELKAKLKEREVSQKQPERSKEPSRSRSGRRDARRGDGGRKDGGQNRSRGRNRSRSRDRSRGRNRSRGRDDRDGRGRDRDSRSRGRRASRDSRSRGR